MQANQVSQLIALSLIASPMALQPAIKEPITSECSDPSRAATRKMKHILSVTPQEIPMGVYVGELQERWQFPSDHLPISMTIDGNHILSWNVLDAKYMGWVIDVDSQGIKRSLISDEHIYIDDSDLTIRDVHIADMIVQAINHPTHPKSLLALQECSQAFLDHLRTKLPQNFEITGGGNAMIIDTDKYEIISTREVFGIFSQDTRPVNEIILLNRETGEHLRLINNHLPGDPNGPARFELAQYLARTQEEGIITIAMGDMNFNEVEMSDAMKEARLDFTIYSPYCTNIATTSSDVPFVSKAIDHFIILGDSQGRINPILNPEDAMEGLRETAELLMPSLGEQKSFQKKAG